MSIPFRYPIAGGNVDEYPRLSPRATVDASGAPLVPPALIITRSTPEESAPPASIFFAQSDSAAVVGAAVIAPLPNVTLALDAQNYGVLKSLDVFVTPWTGTSSVFFQLLVNGSPVRGFERIGFVPAPLALVSRGFDLSLALPQGATITVQAVDVDGAAYTVGAELFGWQWPVAIDARYRPEGAGVR